MGHLALELQQRVTRQEATSPSKAAKVQPENFAAEQAPRPGLAGAAAPSHDSNTVAVRVTSVWVKEGAHTADPDLSIIAGAGSSSPAQMTTRKRPRPITQLQEAQPSRGNNGDSANVSSSIDAEGVEFSPRPSRSTKQQALHGKSEALSQLPIPALQVIEQLASPEQVKLADEHSVVWCRLKGFPAWPVSYAVLFHLYFISNYHLASVCDPAIFYWCYKLISQMGEIQLEAAEPSLSNHADMVTRQLGLCFRLRCLQFLC